jgi:transcriptional regulator with XRE-family HTH domain
VSGKEIGRIERGDVVRPHGATIRSIADTLGVEPAEIETY